MAAARGRIGRIRRSDPAGLTPRQIEGLCLIAEGLSKRQIAERLVVSNRTTTTCRTSILKTGTPSRAAAARFAVQHEHLGAASGAQHRGQGPNRRKEPSRSVG